MADTTRSPAPPSELVRRSVPPPALLIAWEPGYRVFLRNLADLFRRQPGLVVSARPAAYWRDAQVTRQMKPKHFVLSAAWHAFAILLIYVLPMVLLMVPRRVEIVAAKREAPIYAPLSDYLPAVNAGSAPAKVARKGRPKLAKQEVISLPPNPDNFEQTIISPPHPNILKQHVNLPNMVVWNPVIGPAPVAATARQISQIKVPRLDVQVVEPAPADLGRARLQLPALPQPAVVMPEAANVKLPVGELNIAHMDATVEAPAIVLPEQRAVPGLGGPAPVAPPLSAVAAGAKDAKGVGQLLALGLNPTMPTGPIQPPGGSRYGEFAAGPTGKPDAPGTPDIAGGGNGPGGHGTGPGGAGTGNGNGLPGGVYVAPPPPGASVGPVAGGGLGSPDLNGPGLGSGAPGGRGRPGNPGAKGSNTIASLSRPRSGDIPREVTPSPSTENSRLEDRVFGGKRYYQMALNMPNLSSAGGSWIIRFAERNPSPHVTGPLAAPAVLRKVDPAYSGEALRQKIEGTVVLYAIIHADGSVDGVRVLQSLDETLDHNAEVALTRWKFRPASRNGVPEDVEAVVTIPFRISRLF